MISSECLPRSFLFSYKSSKKSANSKKIYTINKIITGKNVINLSVTSDNNTLCDINIGKYGKNENESKDLIS